MSGTKQELHEICCEEVGCIAVDYNPSESYGRLCASPDQAWSSPPPLDPDLAACFKDPSLNRHIVADDNATPFASLNESARICLTSETCGGVMLDASTGLYHTKLAGEAAATIEDAPLNQYVLWEVSDLCMGMVLVCPHQDGKFTITKMQPRGKTRITTAAVM